jgi:repressor LexA
MARPDESLASLRHLAARPPVSPEDDPANPAVEHGLTKRQRAVLDFIWRTLRENGYPPTLREIGEELGIRSTNGVNDHLKALERKGYLSREDLKSRALRVQYYFDENDNLLRASEVEGRASRARAMADAPAAASSWERLARASAVPAPDPDAGSEDLLEVPVLGKVAAGQPILAVEQREDTVRVDRFFIGQNRDVFALRVFGDSMIEAGIFDGDYIFVRKQPTARTGDIVVAMINDEATVKYFHPSEDRIVFKPANSRMRPIEVRRTDWKPVNLLGTVVGVYRRMQ